jgi:multidrug resistance protein, MATE family
MDKNKRPLWQEIILLATPLILSMTGIVVMQFIDAIFLAWYSADAIGAIVPASMGSYLIISPFQATAGFTSTLVAHYVGAGKHHRVFAATWQGIYCAIISGIIVASVGFFAKPIFEWVGHDPSVRPLEEIFFAIMCWGALPAIAGSAVAGFFIGRGKTKILMVIQLSGILINAILDYFFIFGKYGLPQLGITGAALATVAAQLFVLILLMIVFLYSKTESEGHPWTDRHFSKDLFYRLIRYGFPNGLRFGFEMLAWTGFIFIVGRIGINELAATNIVFRINGFAFFPVIGIGQAVAILVGQAQGKRDIRQAIRVTYTGFFLSEIWMIFAASIFILFPGELLRLFGGEGYSNFDEIIKVGSTLLKLVAIYCLLDAGNIIFVSGLQAAGDTKWTMYLSLIANGLFLSALLIADHFLLGIWIEWIIATVFVMAVALIWFWRFRSKAWHSIRIIEKSTEDLLV